MKTKKQVVVVLMAVILAGSGCSNVQSSTPPEMEAPSSTSLPTETQKPTEFPTTIPVTNTPIPPTNTPLPPSPTNDPLRGTPVFTSIVLRSENTADGQVIYQDFFFKDLDGDVNFIDIQLVSTTADDVEVSGGDIDVPAATQKSGGKTTGTWSCGKWKYDVTLQVTLVDSRGNRSIPQVYTMRCGAKEQEKVTLVLTSGTPTSISSLTPEAIASTNTPAQCANGSPSNTWTLIILNKSNQAQTIKVDGKSYTVPAAGKIEVYLSLNASHAVVVGTNTITFANDVSCGENTFTIP